MPHNEVRTAWRPLGYLLSQAIRLIPTCCKIPTATQSLARSSAGVFANRDVSPATSDRSRGLGAVMRFQPVDYDRIDRVGLFQMRHVTSVVDPHHLRRGPQ